MGPNFLVLKAPGINCEAESARAVEQAGGQAEIVHVSQLTSGDRRLRDYQGLFIPGGFSEGDAVRAGIVLALQLKHRLGDDIREMADSGKPVIGVCNGFQVLVNMGILPGTEDGEWRQTASLTKNTSGNFESRWVDLVVNPAAQSPFIPEGIDRIQLPIAIGEGRFMAPDNVLGGLAGNNQVLMQYADPDGRPSMDPSHNPSGSEFAIAAICNAKGNVMGSVPHVERSTLEEQEINHRRPDIDTQPYGLLVVRSVVEYAGNV